MKVYKPDLEKAVIFLKTRVSKIDVDDWGKFRGVLRFVHCTLEEKRAFDATNLNEIFTWVDVSYAIHYGMRSQTGGAMSMGLGVTHFSSSKQKLNKKAI